MTRQHSLESTVAADFAPESWNDLTVLVAVSGGSDSVALLSALQRLRLAGKGQLVVAHFNHRMRATADRDEAFVRELAERLKLPVEIGVAAKPTSSSGDGVEAAARDARYDFLKQTAGAIGARYVVTAHTADDQAETILHRILRGASIRGAAGIRRARPLMVGVALLRPLLNVTHAEVLDYLSDRKQAYCEDETHAQLKFLRNRIRNQLMPLLEKEYQTGVRESLLRFGRLAEEASDVLADAVASVLPDVAECRGDQIRILSRPFSQLRPHLARLVLLECWRAAGWPERDMSFAKWEWLRRAAASQSSADLPATLPGAIQVRREGENTVLAKISAD